MGESSMWGRSEMPNESDEVWITVRCEWTLFRSFMAAPPSIGNSTKRKAKLYCLNWLDLWMRRLSFIGSLGQFIRRRQVLISRCALWLSSPDIVCWRCWARLSWRCNSQEVAHHSWLQCSSGFVPACPGDVEISDWRDLSAHRNQSEQSITYNSCLIDVKVLQFVSTWASWRRRDRLHKRLKEGWRLLLNCINCCRARDFQLERSPLSLIDHRKHYTNDESR